MLISNANYRMKCSAPLEDLHRSSVRSGRDSGGIAEEGFSALWETPLVHTHTHTQLKGNSDTYPLSAHVRMNSKTHLCVSH